MLLRNPRTKNPFHSKNSVTL